MVNIRYHYHDDEMPSEKCRLRAHVRAPKRAKVPMRDDASVRHKRPRRPPRTKCHAMPVHAAKICHVATSCRDMMMTTMCAAKRKKKNVAAQTQNACVIKNKRNGKRARAARLPVQKSMNRIGLSFSFHRLMPPPFITER